MPYRPWIHRNTSSMLYRNKYEYIVYVFHSGPKCENYLNWGCCCCINLTIAINIFNDEHNITYVKCDPHGKKKRNFGHNVVVKYGDK